MPCKIKVCGLKQKNNILEVASLKPDYLGFIYYSKSPRYLDNLNIIPFTELGKSKATLVVVNVRISILNELLNDYPFSAVQFSGNESLVDLTEFKLNNPYVEVFKAFGVDEKFDFNLKHWLSVVDYFLFDTKTASFGGSGKRFDWRQLEQLQMDCKFFISGGLRLEYSPQILDLLKKDQRCVGIDLNSGFESEPGIKDCKLIEKFLESLK